MQPRVDLVFELLKDCKWHAILEISQKTEMHQFKIEILAGFLSDYSFLKLDKKEKKVKLSEAFAQLVRKAGE